MKQKMQPTQRKKGATFAIVFCTSFIATVLLLVLSGDYHQSIFMALALMISIAMTVAIFVTQVGGDKRKKE